MEDLEWMLGEVFLAYAAVGLDVCASMRHWSSFPPRWCILYCFSGVRIACEKSWAFVGVIDLQSFGQRGADDAGAKRGGLACFG